MPAKEPLSATPAQWERWLVRVIGIVFLHAHGGIPTGLFLQVSFPGLVGSNLKDYLRRWSMYTHAPAAPRDAAYPFDYRQVGSQWVFVLIRTLEEVEILINGAGLCPKEPLQHVLEVVYQLGVRQRFPHQVLLGGVGIVVVNYLIFDLIHDSLLLVCLCTFGLP